MSHLRSLLLFATLLLLPALACAQGAREKKPIAVATTAMVGDVVRAVAGDTVDVRVLIGAGVDPHLYTPTRDDVALLMQAKFVFHNGLLLEGRMGDTLRRLGKSRKVVAIAEAVPEETILHDAASHHPDPHLWMDAKAWGTTAAPVAAALAAEFPGRKEQYEARAAEYAARMAALDNWAREAIATIPAGRRVLVTAHDAFRYFSRAYGIEVHGIQGISTESEAGLRDLNRLVDMLVERKIPAIFVESTVADRNVRALVEGAAAKGHAVALGGTLFSDAMGPSGTPEGTYPGMVRHNVATIVKALGGTVPPVP
jgi:manganese/zinc/iron transport system substrate-binding protein